LAAALQRRRRSPASVEGKSPASVEGKPISLLHVIFGQEYLSWKERESDGKEEQEEEDEDGGKQ